MPSLIAAQPKEIYLFERPPALGGTLITMSPEELEETLNIKLEEKVETDIALPQDVPGNISGKLSVEHLKSQLESLLSSPRNDLALAMINRQVGLGVFALADIPKDSVVCFYAGQLIQRTQVKSKRDPALGYYGLDIMFSTASYRGIASYFQHLPSNLKTENPKDFQKLLRMTGQTISEEIIKLEHELYSIEFKNGTSLDGVATANLRLEYITHNDLPIILFVTDQAIKKGEQLGFNYGYQYWQSKGQIPLLFDRLGNVFPVENYQRNFGVLSFDSFQYIGDFKPLIDQLVNGTKLVEVLDTVSQATYKIEAPLLFKKLQDSQAISSTDSLPKLTPSSNTTKPTLKNFSLSGENELKPLLAKYKLPDNSQPSLEKGLRNAASNNQLDDLMIFAKHVKNLDAQDSNPQSKKTAAHWAAIKGHKDCYNHLMYRGANLYIPDASGTIACQIWLKQEMSRFTLKP